jgi:short-subunit dehydrogenase
MQLIESRALLTGAAGGIGRAIAVELIRQGAQVLLVDKDERALDRIAVGLPRGHFERHPCDLTSAPDRQRLCEVARGWRGGVNIVINNAGLNPFGLYEGLAPEKIDACIAVNVQAPMHLCHELIPHLRRMAPSAIVNTGSVFGAIGYPGYVAYATTKFALRGFSEALRRELDGSGITVRYLAPRATRTPINSPAVEQMNRDLGVTMDPPERVAQELVSLIRSKCSAAVIGWPEKLFVKINGLLPGVVDRAIRKQRPIIESYASAGGDPAPLLMPVGTTANLRKQMP